MSSEGSVTRWLNQIQDGDAVAAELLWSRYFGRMVALARKKLHNNSLPIADEEDVALSAFDSFCRNAEQGRFPRLMDREGLWRLLVVITARKAAHLIRDEGRKKRGGGHVPVRAPLKDLDCAREWESVLSREPTPDFAVQVAEEFERLLAKLGDKELEQVALWRMDGLSIEEIATKLGYAPRSVKRKLHLIRTIWQNEGQP